MPKALITGVNGQDGAYLAKLLLDKGYEVVGAVLVEQAPFTAVGGADGGDSAEQGDPPQEKQAA